MEKFGFPDLIIWQRAVEQSDQMFDLADMLEELDELCRIRSQILKNLYLNMTELKGYSITR